MRIRTLILFGFLLVSFIMQAQTYTVYSVIGSAKIVKGKSTIQLQPRKQLSTDTHLLIERESAVTILDEKNAKMYSFATEGSHTVRQLVDMTRGSVKNISKQYMSYLVKQLFSDGSQYMSHPDTYMQVTATSYRSATSDSMLLCRMTQLLSGANGTVEQLLCSPNSKQETDMDVSFELVSCDTGFPISNNVKSNTGGYVRVHNKTNEAVYVNVLDIDDKGNKYLVLPVDSAATCAHLLVPPMSTVSFKSEPFIFSDEPANETFVLIATLEPVDFSILMNPIYHGGNNGMKSGIYRNFYHVE